MPVSERQMWLIPLFLLGSVTSVFGALSPQSVSMGNPINGMSNVSPLSQIEKRLLFGETSLIQAFANTPTNVISIVDGQLFNGWKSPLMISESPAQ